MSIGWLALTPDVPIAFPVGANQWKSWCRGCYQPYMAISLGGGRTHVDGELLSLNVPDL